MLGAVHLDPRVSVPALVLLLAALGWYWLRLGAAEVPRSRRWIRRASLLLMVLAAGLSLRALSFLDPELEGDRLGYLATWGYAVLAVAAVGLSAIADVVNTMRLALSAQAEAVERAAREVMDDLEKARRR